jgi:hypothetical protein
MLGQVYRHLLTSSTESTRARMDKFLATSAASEQGLGVE